MNWRYVYIGLLIIAAYLTVWCLSVSIPQPGYDQGTVTLDNTTFVVTDRLPDDTLGYHNTTADTIFIHSEGSTQFTTCNHEVLHGIFPTTSYWHPVVYLLQLVPQSECVQLYEEIS